MTFAQQHCSSGSPTAQLIPAPTVQTKVVTNIFGAGALGLLAYSLKTGLLSYLSSSTPGVAFVSAPTSISINALSLARMTQIGAQGEISTGAVNYLASIARAAADTAAQLGASSGSLGTAATEAEATAAQVSSASSSAAVLGGGSINAVLLGVSAFLGPIQDCKGDLSTCVNYKMKPNGPGT